MNRAIVGATLAGALVFVTSICWTQSWAQDQGRPPAPPALVGMGLPEVPPEQVGMSKQKLDRIHDALKQHVADGKLPGTVVLVARKGKLIYADVTGFQDKDEGKPMALDSLFRIYSMTKPLVSVAAMMLVEDGTIQLTDPVSKFFPAFKGQQVSVARSDNELARMSYITVAAEREMTVQDLLRHTAGLAYGEITVNAPVRDAYAKAGLYLAGVRDYDARELTPAEEVERLAKAPLAHQPGTVWEYSMAVARPRGRSRVRQAPDGLSRRARVQAAEDARYGVLGAFRQDLAPRTASRRGSRQRTADQGHRRLQGAKERFRRRWRGLDCGGLSALLADAAQRRPARRHAHTVTHDRRVDDLRSSRQPNCHAVWSRRAPARHPRLHIRARLCGSARRRDRRRAGLGGRVHVGRLCRNLFLGRPQGGAHRRLHEPSAQPDPRLLPQARQAAGLRRAHGLIASRARTLKTRSAKRQECRA